MNYLPFVFAFVFAIAFAQYRMVEAHEKAHAAVCEFMDGTPKIEYSSKFLGLSGKTTCENLPKNFKLEQYALLNGLVESFGYNILAVWDSLLVLFTSLGVATFAQKNEEKAVSCATTS